MSLEVIYGDLDVTQLALRFCLQNNNLIINASNRCSIFGSYASNPTNSITIIYEGYHFTSSEDIKLNIEHYLQEEHKYPPLKITILYGAQNIYKDVTSIALQKCLHNSVLRIPFGDHARADLFSDPCIGILKDIQIILNGKTYFFPATDSIVIDASNLEIQIPKQPADQVLSQIHSRLKFIGGSLKDEYPEQLMSVNFIDSQAKVLELGSNIGRNTLVIASLLQNQANLVTLECDPQSYQTLLINRSNNNFKFEAENAALSYQPIILNGWLSQPSEVVLPGYQAVKTITFEQLEAKYQIKFDTLVADCEGALYYILLDNPNMLDNIKTVIIENDFYNREHKIFVNDVFRAKKLVPVYSQSGGWGPCQNFFYEVWKFLE